MENWKEIDGFKGKYLISNFGNVKSSERLIGNGKGYLKKEAILKYVFDKDNYPTVSLTTENRKNKTIKIHILVAKHFLRQKPYENSFVCHKDDNKLNTNVNNLYWGDRCSNVKDRYKNGNTFLSIEQVNEARKLFKEGKSQKELIGLYKCNQSFMSRLLNYKRNKF